MKSPGGGAPPRQPPFDCALAFAGSGGHATPSRQIAYGARLNVTVTLVAAVTLPRASALS